MELITERLRIRGSTPADWPAYQRIWTDAARSPYAQYDAPGETEPEKARALLDRLLAGGRFYSVLLRADGTQIGYVCFHGEAAAPDLGYCFHSAWQGRGLAREACAALLEALSCQGARRFTAGTALANAPSVRLLGALGFRLEKTEQVSFYKDEAGRDVFFTGGVFERPAGPFPAE